VPQTAERARTLLQQLSKFKLFPMTSATLQMVCHSDRLGFYTSSIRMKKPHITDLKLHYGDEFPSIHEELLETLQEKDSTGITFLHGPPGTGKTYYLRYLINEIKDKNLIYVPPDLVNVSQFMNCLESPSIKILFYLFHFEVFLPCFFSDLNF
jgi:Cdc6-like AAA superfamily ATPase